MSVDAGVVLGEFVEGCCEGVETDGLVIEDDALE